MRAALLLALGVALGACRSAPESMYDWGRYEECVLELCANPDGYDRAEQIQVLSAQLEETEANGRLAPPGLRAHLAFLLGADGQVDRAVLLLREEMERFPESRAFYVGMLVRMGVEEEAADGAGEVSE